MTDAPWWDDARYGLFVHWGVMSLPARGDQVMQQEHIPVADYERLGETLTADGVIRLGFLDSRATGAHLLAGGDRLVVDQRDDVLTARDLPAAAPDARDTVIAIDLDGGPDALPGSYVFWAGEARY